MTVTTKAEFEIQVSSSSTTDFRISTIRIIDDIVEVYTSGDSTLSDPASAGNAPLVLNAIETHLDNLWDDLVFDYPISAGTYDVAGTIYFLPDNAIKTSLSVHVIDTSVDPQVRTRADSLEVEKYYADELSSAITAII